MKTFFHQLNTPTTNRFSCNKRIWKIVADFPRANDECASPILSLFRGHTLRSPCSRRWQNPGTQYVHSTRILKSKSEISFVIYFLLQIVEVTHAVNSSSFIQSLPADVTEPSFMVRRLGPTMSNRILDQARCDTGTRCHHVRYAFLVDNKVANFIKMEQKYSIREFLENNCTEIRSHFQSANLSKLKLLL